MDTKIFFELHRKKWCRNNFQTDITSKFDKYKYKETASNTHGIFKHKKTK